MAKLLAFNGGLITRESSHIIPMNAAVACINVDTESSDLKPVKTEAASGLALKEYSYYFEAESKWVEYDTYRSFLEYQTRLLIADASSAPVWQQGVNTYNLGIIGPSVAPPTATNGAGILTGKYQYVYTYYSSTTGAESASSPVSTELGVNSNTIRVTLVAATDAQADKIRIYRVGGTLTKFSLVDTIDSSLLFYDDNIADTAIPGDALLTVGGGAALAGADNLKEEYSMVFYTLGDKLYFSAVGQWYNYPPENYISFGKDVTGYDFVSNGILVFTRYKTYLITGNTPGTFSKTLLSGRQGCKNKESIEQSDQGLLWVSEDGLCASNGGLPAVISRPALGKINLQVSNAVIHDDVYYAQLVDGSTFVFDTRYNPVFKYYNLGCTRLVVALDKLYGYFSGQYKELFEGDTYLSMYYQTGTLLDGSYTERKTYNSVYIRHSGVVTVSAYIDGKLVGTVTTADKTDTFELDVNQRLKDGYSIYFVISGTGNVLEIDYVASGNSRP